ncbi:multiple epidermal growth factor-like domains protein 10 [Saccostrea cucullata]|uniref:multiple epidermal growth factor-like domains protein 10 n=1 Tax=Saccostrea cuccullata TaxID=36930 RepID=UPI002ED1D43B
MDTYAADRAVDGKNDTCTRTESIGPNSLYKKVWWYVDLEDIYSVYDITIQFVDYGKAYKDRQRGRFAGFSLYLSNTSRKEDGVLCYKDGPQLPPLYFKTRCIGHGSHVIFYNERLDGTVYPQGYESLIFTELCEVIVRGCAYQGTYGEACERNCPEHCQQNKCDILNGTCLGCVPGWMGKYCRTPCASGSYGLECKHQCAGHCRDDGTCNSVTGNCDKGCASGWTGSLCDECKHFDRYTHPKKYFVEALKTFLRDADSCISGRYGQDCAFNCSGHCFNDKPCNPKTGQCDSGCSDGYTGTSCDTACLPGHYGKNCSNNCSINCADNCRKTDGLCECKAGFKSPPHCNTECPHNRYGKNCNNVCGSNCVNETCNKYNGSCSLGCNGPCIQDPTSLYSKSTSADTVTVGGIVGAIAVVSILSVLIILYTRLRRKQYKGNRTDSDGGIRISKIELKRSR